jgi:hypothetical protein
MDTLIPKGLGEERITLSETGATAHAGTGFDPEGRQHRFGSDAARYAIAIQQLRDARDYAAADRARAVVEAMCCKVTQTKDATCVRTQTIVEESSGVFVRVDLNMTIVDGVLFDSAPLRQAAL